jgi:hypothetical protein
MLTGYVDVDVAVARALGVYGEGGGAVDGNKSETLTAQGHQTGVHNVQEVGGTWENTQQH